MTVPAVGWQAHTLQVDPVNVGFRHRAGPCSLAGSRQHDWKFASGKHAYAEMAGWCRASRSRWHRDCFGKHRLDAAHFGIGVHRDDGRRLSLRRGGFGSAGTKGAKGLQLRLGADSASAWMVQLAILVDLASDGLMTGAGSGISLGLGLLLAWPNW